MSHNGCCFCACFRREKAVRESETDIADRQRVLREREAKNERVQKEIVARCVCVLDLLYLQNIGASLENQFNSTKQFSLTCV